MNQFSFEQYKELITLNCDKLPYKDYSEVTLETASFFVLRHDIEYSIDRSYELAKFENEQMDLKSTYLVQVRNNTYNPFSERNLDLIRKISDMGHYIGLHVHLDGCKERDNATALEEYISKDIETLEYYTGINIDRYSYHRPPHNVLALSVNVKGKLNLYSPEYFHFYSGQVPEKLNVFYTSDSNHTWRSGDPFEIDFNEHKKIQMLIHPFSWSKEGGDNLNNFKCLVQEKTSELVQSLNDEIKTFPPELLV